MTIPYLQSFPYTIGVLGATGNIGSSIVKNLLVQGLPSSQLFLSDSKGGLKEAMRADIVVLGIKPQVWRTLNLPYRNGQIIVSPMAGISVETIKKAALGQGALVKVTRFMPNTACRVNEGLIGSWNPDLSPEDFEAIRCLYHNGEVVEVSSEDDLNKITVAASAIAFYFYLFDAVLDKNTGFLEAALKKAFCEVYLKALEFAGVEASAIQETPIAKQQKALSACLEKPLDCPAALATTEEMTDIFLQALQSFLTENGFAPETARHIANQTVKGAQALLTEPNARKPAELRANVTSKGGTTEAGLRVLEHLLT